MSSTESEWMSPDAAAAVVGLTAITLKRWRRIGKGPPFMRYGTTVRYRRDALDAWMRSHETAPEVHTPLGDYSAPFVVPKGAALPEVTPCTSP